MLDLAKFRLWTSFLTYWVHLKHHYHRWDKMATKSLTSARAFSRSLRGTLRTSWLAALLRRWRGRVCHARCVEVELQVGCELRYIIYLRAINVPGSLHSCMHCIDFECASLPPRWIFEYSYFIKHHPLRQISRYLWHWANLPYLIPDEASLRVVKI